MIMAGLFILALVFPWTARAETAEEQFVALAARFGDQEEREGLFKALARNLELLERLPTERQLLLCDRRYPVSWLIETTWELAQVVQTAASPGELARLVRERFEVCRVGGGQQRMLLTGYYEPVAEARLEKSERFRFPLYAPPPDLVEAGQGFKKKIGRPDQGRLVPYWTRQEIEENDLLAGRELVFLDDPVTAFLFHVQGSGRVRLPDGRVLRVQYAAKNGREYRSIGKLLVDQGKLLLEEADLPGILAYLRHHPDQVESILQHNPSYVFFRWGDEQDGPLGAHGVALTAGRSVALDDRWYPPGTVGYLVSRKPRLDGDNRVCGWEPLARFVAHQDSGSAINGPFRADLFWGAGEAAQAAAGVLRHPAELFVLVKKELNLDP